MNKLFLVAILMFSFSANKANACTVSPVDTPAQLKDMQRFAFAALNITEADLVSMEATEVEANYIWTPMCPKGVTAKATFNISFDNPDDPLTKGCHGVVSVEKTEPTRRISDESVKHEYVVNVVQPGICLE